MTYLLGELGFFRGGAAVSPSGRVPDASLIDDGGRDFPVGVPDAVDEQVQRLSAMLGVEYLVFMTIDRVPVTTAYATSSSVRTGCDIDIPAAPEVPDQAVTAY